jgi:hypothetical protein
MRQSAADTSASCARRGADVGRSIVRCIDHAVAAASASHGA